MHRDNITTADPITAAIANVIVEHIDLDHLARRIAHHLRDTPPNTTGQAETIHPDTPIEADTIRRELGANKRQGTISYPTFQRKYIDTGLLQYCPPPPNGSRSKRYIRHGDWQALKTQIKTKK